MDQELILLPEELYYLGKLLKAKHIDYAYIAAMKDIQQNYEAIKQDVERNLIDRNYIFMDFSGNIDVDDRVRTLLSPVFFGSFESTINTCYIDDKANVNSIRIHSDENNTVCVIFGEGGFHIYELTDKQIMALAAELLPEGYLSAELPAEKAISKENITRIIALKNIIVGQQAEVKVYFETEGLMCCNSGDNVDIVDGITFCADAYRILRGV